MLLLLSNTPTLLSVGRGPIPAVLVRTEGSERNWSKLPPSGFDQHILSFRIIYHSGQLQVTIFLAGNIGENPRMSQDVGKSY